MITQSRDLNLIPGGVPQIINVSQYDKGETLKFALYAGTSRFTIPAQSTIKVQGTKSDGHGFQYNATSNNNEVVVNLEQQMTAAAGDARVEITISKDSQLIATANFILRVEKAALGDGTVISDTDLPDIIAEATAQMEAAAASALKAEGYSIGKQNGTPVGSGSPYYQDNAKYYYEQAAAKATEAGNAATTATNKASEASTKAGEAATSATNASNKALAAEGWATGKQNGTPVGSGSPYYNNNASYYQTQAQQKAAAAGTSEYYANASKLAAEGWATGKQNGTPVGSGSQYYENNAAYYANLSREYVGSLQISESEWNGILAILN